MNPPTSQPAPRVRTTPDGIVIDLPTRQLGRLKWIVVPLLAFGLAFLGGVTNWIVGISNVGSERAGGGGFLVARLVFSLFGLLFVIPALVPIGIGLAVLAGRSSIELTRLRVRRIERVGPFWWSRKRPAEGIRRFKVVKGSEGAIEEGALANLALIRVEFDGSDWLILAPGYTPAMLTEVAEVLAERWNQLTPAGLPNDAGGRIEVVVESARTDPPEAASDEPAVATQPASSAVTVERTADGVVLTVPPAGLLRGSSGLFAFSLCWNGFIAFAAVLWLVGGGAAQWQWGAALILGVFQAIGIAMLVGAMKMGLRRARIETAGDAIRITVSDPFGSRTREWPYGAAAVVRIGPSGMSVNDVNIEELQVHPVHGKKAGFLAGRDAEELRWMATLLRERTGLSSTPKPKAVTTPE